MILSMMYVILLGAENSLPELYAQASSFVEILSLLIGLVLVGSTIFAGIQYTTAGGDSGKVQKAKGRSSRKIQLEFPELGKTYWGKHFWARGYFSATSGGITDEAVTHYINNHSESRHPTPSLTEDKKIN